MRQKIFAIVLAALFIFTQVSPAYAKGSTGGGRAGGSVSSGRSSGSSVKSSGVSGKSSPSKSTAGSSSSSGYSGSSTSKSAPSSSSGSSSRSVPGSYSSGSSSSSSGYTGSGSSSSKNTSPASSSAGGTGSASSSSGYTGSGSSSSKSTSPASSSAGGSSTGSAKSSASVPGSGAGTAKSSGSSAGVSSKTETLKNSYMQDSYKKQTSGNTYEAYKQKFSEEQRKTYETSTGKNYTGYDKMNYEDAARTRSQRASSYEASRPVRININTGYFGGFGSPFGYGSMFVGPWDLWFLMRASDLFWYHHWQDISPYRNYFQESQFKEMEERVRRLEQQNNGVRDENYLEPGVDPDLQFSGDYQQKHLNNVYYTDKYSRPVSNPWGTFLVILLIAVVLVLYIRKLSRRKPKKTFESRIY